MPRAEEVMVREATTADAECIQALRRRPAVLDVPSAHGSAQAEAAAGLRVFVAELDGEVVGMVAMGREPVGPVVAALEIAELHVRGGYEQCCVGTALVAAATAQAELLGCEHVLLTLPSSAPETGAVSTRIGLGSSGRRLTPVSMMRRRLGLEPVGADSVVARRRAVLRRVITLPKAQARLSR